MGTKTPIGEVECSAKGCNEVCKVFKFEPRSGRGSAFTGKMYFICVKHGRVGADGSQAVTDYILENGKMFGPNESTLETVQSSSSETSSVIPSRPSQSVQSTPESRQETTKKTVSQPIQAVSKTPVQPTAKPVEPTPEPEKKSKGWFGL